MDNETRPNIVSFRSTAAVSFEIRISNLKNGTFRSIDYSQFTWSVVSHTVATFPPERTRSLSFSLIFCLFTYSRYHPKMTRARTYSDLVKAWLAIPGNMLKMCEGKNRIDLRNQLTALDRGEIDQKFPNLGQDARWKKYRDDQLLIRDSERGTQIVFGVYESTRPRYRLIK